MRTAAEEDIDPIALEVYWNRLVSLMGETDQALLRMALSTIIGESRDFAFLLLDEKCSALSQSVTSLTVFTGILPYTTRSLLKRFPPESLKEGDILLTNDPWLGAGHLPDYCFVKPIFMEETVIGYFSCLGHMQDIGGTLSYFGARDVYEEGLRIPPCKLYDGGEPNEQVLDIIRANSRVPNLVIGDIRAIRTALQSATNQLLEFLNDYGLRDLRAISRAIQDRSESAMRAVVGSLPDGCYAHAVNVDGQGGAPITIAGRVTIDGEELRVDYRGTSPETDVAAVNCSMNYTRGSTLVALKSALVPEIPNNDGLFRTVAVSAPAGCILNCRPPVAVKGRSVVAVHTHDVMFGALAAAVPDKVQAGSGSFWSIGVNGQYADGRPFSASMIIDGGMGASGRKGGLSTTAYPWNSVVTPSEIYENHAPVLITRKELIPGSGGRGRYQGGMGQRISFRTTGEAPVTFTVRPVNTEFPPPGLLGGDDGSLGRVLLNGQPCAKRLLTLQEGEELTLELPGGGGFGAAEPSARREAAE
ncbi:MAG: hydantoinase B/oxoprolinase family protein [Alphaproteobacteria bacterium]|nr:hydantoinase B/oxoprolinase family protein [Alphaproteobacteria bacterium]